MENPIKDNRIVLDKTFAVRFLRFIEDISVSDACSYDELNSMVSYAKSLLKYQCLTADSEEEIAYLKRVGVYEEYTKPYFITFDGVELFDGESIELYSCMREPKLGEQILKFSHINSNFLEKRNKDRIFFADKETCQKHIDYYTPSISMHDLDSAGLLESFNVSKNKENE